MKKVEFNILRLKYLLKLYNISEDELIAMINEGLKAPISKFDIFNDKSEEINLNYLKRIDKIFNRGLNYYLDPKEPFISKDSSIFFRKEKFGTDLNFASKKIVNQFEDLKISLSALAKLSDNEIRRTLNIYNINQEPIKVAQEIRNILNPEFKPDQKLFLKSLISKLSENNIYVFEFIETWNKKEKANIDGFFLNPNVIVLKRNQKSFRREIFTLIHELGHYLLNEEEVEQVDNEVYKEKEISIIEKWCNDFAYYFLIGGYYTVVENLEFANIENDFHSNMISEISKNTHLSILSIYTRLLLQKKISYNDYKRIKDDIEASIQGNIEKEKKQRDEEKILGIKPGGSVPKPINSPLFISTIKTAFYEGVISEYDVRQKLNLKADIQIWNLS